MAGVMGNMVFFIGVIEASGHVYSLVCILAPLTEMKGN